MNGKRQRTTTTSHSRLLTVAASCVFALLAQTAVAQRVRAVRHPPQPSQAVSVAVLYPLHLQAGTSLRIFVQTTVLKPNGISSITYQISGYPSGITITPAQQTTSAPSFPQVGFIIAAAASMPPGSIPATISVVPGGGAPDDIPPETMRIEITPAQFSNATVTPGALTFPAGGSASFVARVRAPAGYPSTITVTPAPASNIVFTPAQGQITPASLDTGIVFNAASSVPGTTSIPIVFSSSTGQQQRVPLTVVVTNVVILPAIDSVVPPAVISPSTSSVLRLGGTNFAPGGVVISRSPDIVVEKTTVYNPTLADVVVTVRPGAPTGGSRLDFRNPDGGVSVRGSTLFVYPPEAIGAPLGVSTAAIVSPVQGSIVASGESVYPRALLATSGSGTVTGYWAVDAIAFDRFNATTSGGMPLEIRAHVPIPPTAWGRHEVTLVIESPKLVRAPAVSIESGAVSATRLTIYEPLDRAIVEGAPRIRWTIVPGAGSYMLELRQLGSDGHETAVRRIRTTATEWTPKDLGSGPFRLRVRSIFPGEVRGEPTAWSTVIVLPSKASLRIDGAAGRRVAWSGGTPGMIYRVEFLHDNGRCFDALTFVSEYRLPSTAGWRGCDAVRVRALTPSGRLLGASEPRHLGPDFAVAVSLVRAGRPPDVVERFPDARTTAGARAAVGVRWRGAAGDDLALILDGTDVTAAALREPGGITYEALLPLRNGTHVASLATAGTAEEWTFDVADDPVAASPARTARPGSYVLSPGGSVVWSRKSPGKNAREEHASLSSQGEAGDATAGDGMKATGDLAYAGTSDPKRLAQESRNWVGEGRMTGKGLFGSARLGYTTPDFTDGAEFLTSGVARTGVIARAGSAYGAISYYEPVDPAIHGVLSASPENLKIRTFALSSPEGRPYIVRLIGLQVDEPADTHLGTSGSSMRTYGIFARYTLGNASFVIETARGRLETAAGSGADNRSGNAMHLGVDGTIAGATYALNVRSVGADFVNPANRGLTAAVTDRQAADLSVSRTFGRNLLTVTLGHQSQGRSHDSKLPQSAESKTGLALTTTFDPRLSLMTSADLTHDSGDASSTLTLPRTDRLLACASATLSETFTRIGLQQGIVWNHTDDRVTPLSNQNITTLTMAANGALLPRFTLNSSASYSRTRGTPTVGTTNAWTVQLSPAIAVPSLLISLQPTVSISTTSNDTPRSDARTQTYGTIVQWSPSWFSSLLSGQLFSGVTRMTNLELVETRSTSREYRASVTVHLSKSNGLPMFAAPPPIPGAIPTLAPEQSTSGQTEAGGH